LLLVPVFIQVRFGLERLYHNVRSSSAPHIV